VEAHEWSRHRRVLAVAAPGELSRDSYSDRATNQAKLRAVSGQNGEPETRQRVYHTQAARR
jgi:hypothetical protein